MTSEEYDALVQEIVECAEAMLSTPQRTALAAAVEDVCDEEGDVDQLQRRFRDL